MSLRPVGLESCLPFTFTTRTKMTFDNFTLGSGKALTVLSIERHKGEEDQMRCHVQGQQEASAEVCIPLSSHGEFYECESEECFTLREIMSSSSLRSRRFRFTNTTKCDSPLLFTPIFQVHAVMSSENNLLFIFLLKKNELSASVLYIHVFSFYVLTHITKKLHH